MSQPPESPDPLNDLLDRFEAPACKPPLKTEVWRRIQALDTQEESRLGFGWLFSFLAKPPVAVLFVACCLFLGLFLAEVRVSRLEHARSVRFAKSYLELVDPVLRSDTGGQP